MEEVVTQADQLYIDQIYKGKSPWEAAIKAFPMMDDPVEYALELIDTNLYVKQRLRGYFERHGLSDEAIVQKFVKILDKTMGVRNEENALMDTKNSITVLKEICKLKDLYPNAATTTTGKAQDVADPTSQSGMLQIFMENAVVMMPKEELTKKVRSPIIDIPALEDKDVFDGP